MIYKHNEETVSFANNLLKLYAKCQDGFFQLNPNHLSEFDRQKLASLIMKHDQSYASEATGPDNQSYDEMQLKLQNFLTNPLDKEIEYEYLETWRECVTNYFSSCIEELIDQQLEIYNQDHEMFEFSDQYMSKGINFYHNNFIGR